MPIITLTTDFGTADHYVSSVKAAILSVTSHVQIVDVTHEVPAHDLISAGFIVKDAYRAFPPRTVHIVVVDPGVGMARKPIVVASDNHYFVGPDNGVFSQVYDLDPTFKVHEITATHYMRENPSPTFHGRDIFAPSAAQLARGIELENFGDQVTDPVKIEIPRPKVTAEGQIRATVIRVDRFGNLVTNVTQSALANLMQKLSKPNVRGAGKAASASELHATYGEAPEGGACLLYNSAGYLEIAANKARASEALGLKAGDPLELELY